MCDRPIVKGHHVGTLVQLDPVLQSSIYSFICFRVAK